MASVERAPVIGQRFQPGEIILHRMFTAEHLVFVRTAQVIGHDERGLRLWIAQGCPLAVRMSADGRGLRDMPFREWIEQPTVLETTVWRGPDIFMLVPPDRAHSVYWFWNEAGVFDGWYVNLEDRAVLWRDGELAGRHLKRAHLELGGNSAMIVLEDADVDAAVGLAAWGSYFHQGQICMTTGRHLVHERIYDDFVQRVKKEKKKWETGKPQVKL